MGGRDVPVDMYVPPGEGTHRQEADLKEYEAGYLAGVEYAQAENRRLQAELAEAQAELSAIRRHPSAVVEGHPNSYNLREALVKAHEVLSLLAHDMAVCRRDIGSVASVLERRFGGEDA